jgi:glycosyltransferase involved in cell wall biosynthesis
MNMTDISVIICAYTEQRWSQLVEAVESVRKQTLAAREIILVIDHNPMLMERARRYFSDVILLQNRETRGLAGARNTGIAATSGRFIAFLDDDAVAQPDWLEMLSTGFADSRVVAVGGMLEPLWPHGRPGWFPDEFDWVVGCTYRGLPEQTSLVRNLIGANMSFRREVFNEVKFYSGIGHNGAKPFGGSDPDFCIRVTQRWSDKVCLYEPKARVYHYVDEKRTSWSYFCLRCCNEGLSKAVLTSRVGAQSALSSERRYTFHTLPRGVLRGLKDAMRGDLSGLGRATAIIAGLTITTAGYFFGLISQRITEWKMILRPRITWKRL